jgi:hypothetical protein
VFVDTVGFRQSFLILKTPGIRLIRAQFGKCGVWPILVIEDKPNFQIFAKLNSVFVGFQVDPFVFQGAPESFDKDVVLEPSLAVHADFDAGGLEYGGEAGEVVGVSETT